MQENGDRPVAMGRLIGDGGWYFHVVDMAVLPEHQRRGLGSAVRDYLLAQVRERSLQRPAFNRGWNAWSNGACCRAHRR